jgi:hypothetical protein
MKNHHSSINSNLPTINSNTDNSVSANATSINTKLKLLPVPNVINGCGLITNDCTGVAASVRIESFRIHRDPVNRNVMPEELACLT